MAKAATPLRFKATRNTRGSSLVELMVATLIASLLGVLAMGSLLACMKANSTTTARIDGSHNMTRALERLARGVRSGSNLGDFNRQYGTLQRWTCDNQNLVVQVPVANADGFTLTIDDPVPGDDPVSRVNCETLVYQVLPDKTRAGMYLLQMTRYPGTAQGTYVPGKVGTQTLLTGIVNPKVFQYVDLTDTTGTARDTVDMARNANYKVVVVNVETAKRDKKGKTIDAFSFKSQYFLRNAGRS